MKLFDLNAYGLHQKRARNAFKDHAFLFHHVARELTARLENFDRSFKKILCLSPHPLGSESSVSFRRRPESSLDPGLRQDYKIKGGQDDIQQNTFDLIFSCLEAHWIEDLPAYLKRIHTALDKRGLFLGALPGGQTLCELRASLLEAEVSLTGGAGPRIAPMLHPADAPHLLGRAGFSSPVVDTETLKVTYPTLTALMKDLRGMGETNILSARQKTFTSRRLFETAEEIYRSTFAEADGTLRATFEILYLTGWKVKENHA